MPTEIISREERRELILSALRGEKTVYALAKDSEISKSSLYQEVGKARERYEEEYEYWKRVKDAVESGSCTDS